MRLYVIKSLNDIYMSNYSTYICRIYMSNYFKLFDIYMSYIYVNLFDIYMSFKDLMTYIRILIRHIYTSVIS